MIPEQRKHDVQHVSFVKKKKEPFATGSAFQKQTRSSQDSLFSFREKIGWGYYF